MFNCVLLFKQHVPAQLCYNTDAPAPCKYSTIGGSWPWYQEPRWQGQQGSPGVCRSGQGTRWQCGFVTLVAEGAGEGLRWQCDVGTAVAEVAGAGGDGDGGCCDGGVR